MGARKRRSTECGIYDRGRVTFHRHEYEVMRAFLKSKMEQVEGTLARLKAVADEMRTDRIAGQIEYFACVAAWLRGVWHGGMASIDAPTWDDAWRHVTTVGRHAGSDARDDQSTIPGME